VFCFIQTRLPLKRRLLMKERRPDVLQAASFSDWGSGKNLSTCAEARRRRNQGVMRAFMWQDGRVFGFDSVEWLSWLVAINVAAMLTLLLGL
jgi:hypothetical protein